MIEEEIEQKKIELSRQILKDYENNLEDASYSILQYTADLFEEHQLEFQNFRDILSEKVIFLISKEAIKKNLCAHDNKLAESFF